MARFKTLIRLVLTKMTSLNNNGVVSVVVIGKDGDIRSLSDNRLPPIYLVGPMGSGKTTIGKLLAKQLNRPFVDCDWHIMAQTGTDIAWIFEKEGEVGFRERETRALAELTAEPNLVMATGGGAVIRPENRELLKKGLVIYLQADVDVQLARTKKDKNRPLLHTDNPKAVLETLYKQRHPLYLEIADIVVPTGKLYPKQMVHDVLSRIVNYLQPKNER